MHIHVCRNLSSVTKLLYYLTAVLIDHDVTRLVRLVEKILRKHFLVLLYRYHITSPMSKLWSSQMHVH